MISICAWCTTIMREKEPFDDQNETHGICPACAKKHFGMTDEQISRALDRALVHEPRSTKDLAVEVATTALCILAVAWLTACATKVPEHNLYVRCPDGHAVVSSIERYKELSHCTAL